MWREENVKRSRCPEKETPKDKDAKRKRKAAETTSVSRDSDDIMSRARNVKEKDSQEITQSTAVPARGSGAVPIGSPLSLLGSSLSRNFRHPACPGSTCIYIYIYIHIYNMYICITRRRSEIMCLRSRICCEGRRPMETSALLSFARC